MLYSHHCAQHSKRCEGWLPEAGLIREILSNLPEPFLDSTIVCQS